MNSQTCDYDDCRDALEWAESDLEPAEFHGTVCGLLCVGRSGQVREWLPEIVVTEVGLGAHSAPLEAAGERARAALVGQDMTLELMLPDDDYPMSERAQALADWCTGFLFGVGLAGDESLKRLSPDAQEVMTDLIEFSRMDAQAEDDESAESAYAELVEYIRVGVQLIHEELCLSNQPQRGSNRIH